MALTTTLAIVAFATALKDIIEVAREIRDAFERVNLTFRLDRGYSISLLYFLNIVTSKLWMHSQSHVGNRENSTENEWTIYGEKGRPWEFARASGVPFWSPTVCRLRIYLQFCDVFFWKMLIVTPGRWSTSTVDVAGWYPQLQKEKETSSKSHSTRSGDARKYRGSFRNWRTTLTIAISNLWYVILKCLFNPFFLILYSAVTIRNSHRSNSQSNCPHAERWRGGTCSRRTQYPLRPI